MELAAQECGFSTLASFGCSIQTTDFNKFFSRVSIPGPIFSFPGIRECIYSFPGTREWHLLHCYWLQEPMCCCLNARSWWAKTRINTPSSNSALGWNNVFRLSSCG